MMDQQGLYTAYGMVKALEMGLNAEAWRFTQKYEKVGVPTEVQHLAGTAIRNAGLAVGTVVRNMEHLVRELTKLETAMAVLKEEEERKVVKEGGVS